MMHRLIEAVCQGDAETVLNLISQGLAEGIPSEVILSTGLIAGMDLVGKKMKEGELYLPEVMIAARAMKMGMGALKQQVGPSTICATKIVLGTVKGDLHDIGKNLVGMMLEGAGFKVVDLGVDVSTTSFIDTLIKEQASILGLSSLLSTTMTGMGEIIAAVRAVPEISRTIVLVGGAPLTAQLAVKIGADGYGPDAASAVDLVRKKLKIS